MALDERLLAILVCPQDRGGLYYLGDDDGLYNPRLRRRYEVKDGIPVMLIGEAVAATTSAATTPRPSRRTDRVKCRGDSMEW